MISVFHILTRIDIELLNNIHIYMFDTNKYKFNIILNFEFTELPNYKHLL